MKTFEFEQLAKGILVFKNVLKDPQHTYDVIKKSQTEPHELFTEWMDWGITGLKTTMDPFDTRDLNNDPGQLILELKSIFYSCFSIYRNGHVDINYLKSLNIDPHYRIPASDEEARNAHGWGSADILIIDYANSQGNDGFINGYHTDRTPYWGGSPHAFTLNVYPNDNFKGGGLYFINMQTQEKKFTDNGNEYYEIDEPIYYEPKAGEALLFPSDQYHGVSQVYDGEKLFIRMFMESPRSNDWPDMIKGMTQEEIKIKTQEAREQVFKDYAHEAAIWKSTRDIDNSRIDKSRKFIIR